MPFFFFFFERQDPCCSQDLVVPRFRVCKESGKDGGGGALLKYVLDKGGYLPRTFCDSID